MKRIVRFVLFAFIFFIGYLALNYYVFYRITTLFGVFMTNSFHFLVFCLTLSYPVAALIERNISNLFTRILYTISSTWIGVLFFLFYFLIVYEIVKIFFNISPLTAGMTIIISTVILSAYSIINGFFIEIKKIEIPLKNLKKEVRIVQLTDIHIGSIRNSGFLERIVKKTNNLNPDIVLITGDMVDGSAQLHKETFSPINELKAPVFFVMGNHEAYEGLNNVYRVLNATKINVLRDEMIEFDGIQLIGVEYSFDGEYLSKVLPEFTIQKTKPSILMHHLPNGLEFSKDLGVDLQLSGHTHNGQVFPFSFIVRLLFSYVNGLYEHNGTYLYVSQGTGTWGPPMRLGSKNEITLIKLKKIKIRS